MEKPEKKTSGLAPNALTTLKDIKKYLSIPPEDTSYDEFLIMLINYASSWIETMTGRKFGLKEYAEEKKGSNYQELVMKYFPIREVESIKTKSDALVPAEAYSILETGDIGVIFKYDGWYRSAFPTGLVPDYPMAKRYLTIKYKAGYVLPKDIEDDTPVEWMLPWDLQGLIWQIVSHELAIQTNDSDGLSAFSISDVSWTFDKAPRESWLSTINEYKVAA